MVGQVRFGNLVFPNTDYRPGYLVFQYVGASLGCAKVGIAWAERSFGFCLRFLLAIPKGRCAVEIGRSMKGFLGTN
jgi:hypothetical protein